MDGWIKLHRVIIDSKVFKHPDHLRLWLWLLLKASHSERCVAMNTGRGQVTVTVKPGQLLFGRNQAARELEVPPSTLWKWLKLFERDGRIQMFPSTHWTVISVCNWSTFQTETELHLEKSQKRDRLKRPIDQRKHKEKSPPTKTEEQARNRLVTGKEQARNTNKNVKKDENGQKDENSSSSSMIISFAHFSLPVKKMAGLIQRKNGREVSPAEWDELTRAAYVIDQCEGPKSLERVIDTAAGKADLKAGYFTTTAINKADTDGYDFDQMKKEAPELPFDPPPMLQDRSANTGVEYERARSEVIRRARAEGREITDAEADTAARRIITKAGAG